MSEQKTICPHCNSHSGVDILYGYPTGEGFEKAKRGELAFGGCIIQSGQPNSCCLACGHRWLARRPNDTDESFLAEVTKCEQFLELQRIIEDVSANLSKKLKKR